MQNASSRKQAMKSWVTKILLLIVITLTGCNFPTPTPIPKGATLQLVDTIKKRDTATPEATKNIDSPENAPFPTAIPTANPPTPTLTPNPFANLYDCQMQINFLSGPLENKGTEFEVLGKDYFFDKGDKFEIGKGTGVYYESQHYFILHSSFLNGNIFREMEAEFLRKYLENWGWVDAEYINERINLLKGSEVLWICDGQEIFSTRVNGAIRLSHEASGMLWLEPRNLQEILRESAGEASEWIGEIPEPNQNQLLLGFCGWGPFTLGEERFTYFRYLVSFEILEYYQ